MNIKLKDLLQEQLKIKSDDDVGKGIDLVTPVVKKPVVNNDDGSEGGNSGDETVKTNSCVEINKYTNQYYISETVPAIGSISGTRAVTYDIWKLYTNAANEIRKNFNDENFWKDYKGTYFPVLGGDNEKKAVNWYWGGYFAKPGGKFYDLVYKQYIQKAVDLTRKYADAVYECGDDYEKQFMNLLGTSADPFGKNWGILRQAWIDGRRKTYGDTQSDKLIYKLEHPKGISTYIVDTDF